MCSVNEKVIVVNSPDTYFKKLQDDLSSSYDQMSELQTQLSQVKLAFVTQHNNMLNDNIVAIKSKNDGGTINEDKYNFNDVTR